MIRLWIGTALLAGSWLFGLDYFYPANPWAWLATVAIAVVLFGTTSVFAQQSPNAPPLQWWWMKAIALVLFLPAVWFAPWPYRAAPLLIVLGLALHLLPIRKRWSDRLGHGSVAAGVVMLVQALALEAYANHTMRSHELSWPLPDMLAGVATLLGIDAAADGSTIVMHSMRQVHRLGATWELLFDPATLLFFVGGLTMLAITWFSESSRHCQTPPGDDGGRWRSWIGGLRVLTLVMLAWLLLRAGLLMALYLHRVLRSDPDRPLHAMNHFFSPWMLLLLLVGPVLLAWRFVRLPQWEMGLSSCSLGTEVPSPQSTSIPLPPSALPLSVAAGLIALAVALFTAAIHWDPSGGRKEGRVMVVERHSQWEPTIKPYDTMWFVEPALFGESSGYNYALLYRCLGQFYEMSRLLENDKIDDQTLAKCDVLVIKTPTARYSPAEVDAVARFVEQGGGLLLIGDHTNFANSSTIINDIVRPMGFIFRDDLLFGFGASPYDQSYWPPAAPHPAVQHTPPMDFAVSCSVDPGHSRGRAAIANTGLWSMGPEYHHENYHPVPNHCPPMRYGTFVQAWAAQYGRGRAMAFTDSTIFSNFCLCQPGRLELMLGMVEWLNHANPWANPRPWLLLLGLPPLAAGLWLARGQYDSWLILLAAGTCGWVAASLAVVGTHRWDMPSPECVRPLTRVVIDRTTSTVPLAKGLYPQGGSEGYGILEAWIPRLGCCTVRKEGREAFSGDVLTVICPSRSVPEEFREKLEQYVAAGGKLLVIDSPENTGSTANSLLWPFGLSIRHGQAWQGKLSTTAPLPTVDIDRACEVVGGQPAAKLDKLPVAATVRHGKGSVMAVGFGSLWNDTRMGGTWMTEPDAVVKARYDVLFGLLRSFFNGKPLPSSDRHSERSEESETYLDPSLRSG